MVILVLMKTGIVAATVWVTRDLGVWDDPDTTAAIYHDLKLKLKPYAEDLQQKYCSKYFGSKGGEPPKTWRESCVNAWNDSVRNGFIHINQLPNYCHRFTRDVQMTIDNFINGKAVEQANVKVGKVKNNSK